MDSADLARSMKDHHIDKRGKLSDASARHPVVRPEETGSAIAKMPGSRRTDNGPDLQVAWKGKVTPGTGWVGALKPNPSGTQGQTGTVEVPNGEAPKIQGPANARPVNLTCKSSKKKKLTLLAKCVDARGRVRRRNRA